MNPAGASAVTAVVGEDGVARIEMGDGSGRNALTRPFVAELLAAVREVARADTVKVVVLLGLPEIFSAGGSREFLLELVRGDIAPGELFFWREFLDLPVPTIAALEGNAAGGGLALGLSADLILIARESRYWCSFMDLGFTPGMGTTRLLEGLVGPAIAHEMLYAAEPLKGAHFEGRSGFNYVLPRAEVRPRALALAAAIADKPRPALVALKRVLAASKRAAFEAARPTETLLHELTLAQPELRRRIEDRYAQ